MSCLLWLQDKKGGESKEAVVNVQVGVHGREKSSKTLNSFVVVKDFIYCIDKKYSILYDELKKNKSPWASSQCFPEETLTRSREQWANQFTVCNLESTDLHTKQPWRRITFLAILWSFFILLSVLLLSVKNI